MATEDDEIENAAIKAKAREIYGLVIWYRPFIICKCSDLNGMSLVSNEYLANFFDFGRKYFGWLSALIKVFSKSCTNHIKRYYDDGNC